MITGIVVGYILERGDFCFHSTWRQMLRRPPQADLFRAYLLLLLISIPVVQGMIGLGWIEPWIPPFAWRANLIGGLIFGVGMVVASSCITGLFYKLGHGMLGTLLALGTWALGDLLTYRGRLSPVREALNASPLSIEGQSVTVLNLLGIPGVILLLAAASAAALYLWRSPRNARGKLWGWLPLGLAMGVALSASWLLARVGGTDYTFGTSGVPTGIFEALTGQRSGGSPWIAVALVSLVPGAFVAAWRSGTLWIRGETLARYLELGLGGFLMGVGAGLAGGCNLGHSMVGVPLLSLGSLTTTVAIVAGVFLMDRALKIMRTGTAAQPAPAKR